MSRSKPSVLLTANSTGLPLRRASCATNWSCGVTPRAAVDQHDQAIGLRDGALGLRDHQTLDESGVFDQAARVDHDARYVGAPRESVLPIAREAGQIGDQCVARAGHRVEQGRFAHVGPTDQCDYGQHVALSARAFARAPRRRAESAAKLPLSVSTTTVSLTATGGLLTRNFATRWRATSAPGRLVEPMQIPLIVGDRDRRAGHCRRAQTPPLKLVVAPDLGPVALAQRHHARRRIASRTDCPHRPISPDSSTCRAPTKSAPNRARAWRCGPESLRRRHCRR